MIDNEYTIRTETLNHPVWGTCVRAVALDRMFEYHDADVSAIARNRNEAVKLIKSEMADKGYTFVNRRDI